MNVDKIEIGSGKWPHAGYKTIDIEPTNNPDIVGDFRTMNFSNIEEIRAHHLLEHFSRVESLEVLKQWYSWLKLSGILIIETPDFERICEFFHSDKYWASPEDMIAHVYGSQEAEWAFHKDGWYKAKFEEVLPKLGFKINLIKQKHSYIRRGVLNTRYRLPNILVIAQKI